MSDLDQLTLIHTGKIMEKLELLGGKYTVIYDPETELISEVLRYGQPWRHWQHGDNLIQALFQQVLELSKALHKTEEKYQEFCLKSGIITEEFKASLDMAIAKTVELQG